MAGIIDSEGSVGLSKNRCKPKSVIPYIGIYNVNKKFLEEIKRIIGVGGSINNAVSKLSNRPQYRLRFSCLQIKRFLPKVIPYLIIKRQNAEIVLEVCRLTWHGGRTGISRRLTWSDEYFQKLESLYLKLKDIQLVEYGRSFEVVDVDEVVPPQS